MNFGPLKTAIFRTPFLRVLNLLQSFFAKGFGCFVVTWILILCLILPQSSIQACTVSCVGTINQPLPLSGTVTLTPDVFLANAACNPTDFTLNITNASGTSYGATVGCLNIGEILTATVTEIATGLYCSSTLVVYDLIDPVINCTDTLILCTSDYSPATIGYPAVSDNCTVLTDSDLSYSDVYTDLACFTMVNGDTITAQIEREWTVMDAYGNTDTCIQNIYVKRSLLSEVVFPSHFNGFVNPALDCNNDDPYDLNVTGRPTVGGIEIDNAGHCEFVVGNSDQVIDLCGPGGYTVLRTWTIIDHCTNDFIVGVQIISVKDTTAPVITCPQDVTVNTSTYDCSATVLLPTANATDDCSAFNIEASWTYGTGTGPFFSVLEGMHTVTYTATDDCSNSSTCAMNVTIADNAPPVAICSNTLEIDLTIDGTARANAIVFDGGSHDNCGIDRYEVSRDGITFDTLVYFDCSDIDISPIIVTLRIYDIHGNYNECDIDVFINDRIPPAIVCPSSVTLQCFEDVSDLNLTGIPNYFDNCTVDTLYFQDIPNLNTCGIGSILRTWTILDLGGSSATCQQTIILEDTSTTIVQFPVDFYSSVCNVNTNESNTGTPIITSGGCTDIGINKNDELFTISYPACYKILRHWTVVDWCVYDANSGSNAGRWTHTQLISITDNDAPVLTCLPDTIISTQAQSCDGVYIQPDPVTATDCQSNLTITNDSPYATSNGPDASGTYPVGQHTVTFTTADGCGNVGTCSFIIEVIDEVAPALICENGLVVSLGMNGTVNVDADLILYSAWDNCTDSTNLTYSLFPNNFTCTDIGNQPVTLTVSDLEGNTNQCNTEIIVQDNLGACPFVTLSGTIETEDGDLCENVSVNITGGANQTELTDQNGSYTFSNMPLGSNFTIDSEKDFNDLNGVNAFDLILLSRHILNIDLIDSPYARIAADVNGSGSISTLDMVYIRRLILYIDSEFSNVDSWQFIDADYVFNDSNPFDEAFPRSIFLNNQTVDAYDLDFVGIKSGDVNTSANPNSILSAKERTFQGGLDFHTNDLVFNKNENIALPISCERINEMEGFQFTLDFDQETLSFLNVEVTEYGKSLGFNSEYFGTQQIEEGLLTHVWSKSRSVANKEAPLFIVHFKSEKEGRISETINLNSSLTPAIAFDEKLDTWKPTLTFKNSEFHSLRNDLEVTAYPNPFVDKVNLDFSLEKEQDLFIEVFDVNGRLQFSKKEFFQAGKNTYTIDRTQLQIQEGILAFRISSNQAVLKSGKLLLESSSK